MKGYKMTQTEMLLKVKELLDKNNIKFWLMAGTALGAYRDKSFVSWDTKDIDIGLYYKDYWKAKKVIEESEFSFKWIWRKEFAIHYGEEFHPHLDFIFHDIIGNDFYWYFYTPNPINKIWNVEGRCKLPKKILEPLKKIKFLDTTFRIPGNIEKYLEGCYTENWKTPDNTWHWSKIPSIDKEYQPITAIVPTFLRDECLKKLISSLRVYYPTMPLIIGYQGKQLEPIETDEYTKILELPDDCGLSYARNALVNEVKTPMTWLLDDDFVITPTANVYQLAEIFGVDENIGIVAGRFFQNNKVFPYEKLFEFSGEILFGVYWEALHKAQLVHLYKHNRSEYSYADIVHNFFVAKTEVLKKYTWDNRHKVHSEHLDFFLNLKLNSNVKVAFVPKVLVVHDKQVNKVYNEYRVRQYYDLIYKKYGLKIGWSLGDNRIFNYKENQSENLK
jgi:hypothetical protein